MRLIKSSFEILEQGPGLEGIYEAIERAGRICYKSQAKYQYRNPHTGEVHEPAFKSTFATGDNKIGITTTAEDFYNKYGVFIKESTTAKGFVDRMIASKHYAMLEHGTVYLKVPIGKMFRDGGFMIASPTFYTSNIYYRKNYVDGCFYITTNYRYIIENKLEHWLTHLCEPTDLHERRVTVRFTTSNSIMREFTRHRSHSFAVESTRYCNYSKDKFNNEITFIQPYWYKDQNMYDRDRMFIFALNDAESTYMSLLKEGCSPQEAREVLPLSTKCDMVMTGFVSDWNHFFDLRARGTTGTPHPDAKALAEPLIREFYDRGYYQVYQ